MGKRYLDFIDSLGCCICGKPATHHHLLRVEDKYLPVDNEVFLIPKKYGRGMGKKNDDRFCIPLCHYHHTSLHNNGNERKYLKNNGIEEPVELALSLYNCKENYDDGKKILKKFKKMVDNGF